MIWPSTLLLYITILSHSCSLSNAVLQATKKALKLRSELIHQLKPLQPLETSFSPINVKTITGFSPILQNNNREDSIHQYQRTVQIDDIIVSNRNSNRSSDRNRNRNSVGGSISKGISPWGIFSTALVTGMLMYNPIDALAADISSVSTTSSIPSSPIPSSPMVTKPTPSSPIPSSPIPSTPLPSSPLPSSPLPRSPIPTSPITSTPLPSSPLPFSPLPSSSLVSNGVSNSLLRGPKPLDPILIANNQDKSKGQVLVNLPGNVRESIAAGAANIPGFGQPDVFYPNACLGKWEVTQSYTDISEKKNSLYFVKLLKDEEKKQNNENGVNNEKREINLKNEKKDIPVLFESKYIVNYIPFKNHVVLDRLNTETSKYNSLLEKTDLGNNGLSSAKWDISNPNVLSVSTPDNRVIGTKVTKRAVENDLPEGSFGFSEYSQVFESDSLSGVPKIFGMRVLKRFRGIEGSRIQGVERLYIYDENTLDLKEKPIVVVKSNFSMKKIE